MRRKICLVKNCMNTQYKKGYCVLHRNINKAKVKPKHMSRTPEYLAWFSMKDRCTNKNHPDYNIYGGAGRNVCQSWLVSFQQFLADMGPRPNGLTLERRDNNLGYSKENCYWATCTEQANNRNTNIKKVVNYV